MLQPNTYLAKKNKGDSLKDHAYIKRLERNESEERNELLTLSKNSFPQLTQIFATETPFVKQLTKVKQI